MINVHFKLKEPKSTKATSIRLIIYLNKERLMVGTGLKVLPKLWDKEANRAIKNARLITQAVQQRLVLPDELINLNEKLNNIEDKLQRDYSQLQQEHGYVTAGSLKAAIRQRVGGRMVKDVPISLYMQNYINRAEAGLELSDNNRVFSLPSVNAFKTFLKSWQGFVRQLKHDLGWQELRHDELQMYRQYLNKKQFRQSTINKHLKILKSMMKKTHEDGLHRNSLYMGRHFKIQQPKIESVFLTDVEIKKVEALKNLPDVEAQARDLFLFQYYIAQRFSDVSRVNFTHLKKQGSKMVLDITQQKTNQRVIVPLKTEALAILKKYDYKLPVLNLDECNRAIKRIMDKAGFAYDIEITEQIGGRTVRHTVSRASKISTHTARRSAATNMYLAGVAINDIMKITGHTTEQNFKRYLNIEEAATAERLLEHPYFS